MTQADENARRGRAARAGSADADLVLRSRSGDRDAYAELWSRHYRSGITVARSITSTIDADDLVQEAYTKIYQSILKGGGPTGSFRAYLFTAIRNTAAGWGRSRRETPIDELDAIEDPATSEAATAEALDRGLTHQAFRSLPSRWQEVLWYTEIEQMKPADIAPLLGMKATAVAQLAFRAREGLREAWIQAHLRSVADGSDCQWVISRQGASARGNLGARDRARFDAHLADCTRCAIVAAEAKDVSGRLALILLPLTVGSLAAGGYLAAVQGHGAPVVAMAAMPSEVVEGAVAGTGAIVGIGGSVGVGGSTGSSSGGAAATGSLWGIGALVGAGVASVAIASVVVAAVLIPGVGGSSGVNPAAAFSDDRPAATIEPDPDLIEDPVGEELDEKPPTDDEPAPKPRADRPTLPHRGLINYIVAPGDRSPDAAEAPVEPPVDTGIDDNVQGAGEGPGEDPSDNGEGPITDPEEPETPDTIIDQPAAPTEGTDENTVVIPLRAEGFTYRANDKSALRGPRAAAFSATSDGGIAPGTYEVVKDVTITAVAEDGYKFAKGAETEWPFIYSEPEEPEKPDPGEIKPLDVSGSWQFNEGCETVVAVGVSGQPNETVRVSSRSNPGATTTLGENGTGSITLKPKGHELLFNSPVDVRYANEDLGKGVSTTIRALTPGWTATKYFECLGSRSDSDTTTEAPAESTPAPAPDPNPAPSTPTPAAPAPAPVEPAPTEPAPVEPTPAPAPTEPAPTAPAPNEPAPTAPAPQEAPSDTPALTGETEPAAGTLDSE